MTIDDLATLIDGTLIGSAAAGAREVCGGYCSDLLSDVMANAQEGDVWVTMQRHINIVAVAELKGLAAIVVVNGRRVEPATAARALEHEVTIVTTPISAFDAAGRLYALGVRGSRTS